MEALILLLNSTSAKYDAEYDHGCIFIIEYNVGWILVENSVG